MEKEWKNRPASIAEFEMLWNENKNLEIAKALILSLKDIEGLSFQEKMGFLNEIKIGEFSKPTLEVFLFLMPEWVNDFQDYGWKILSLIDFLSRKIDFLPRKDSTQGLESKIKKFVHSYLNSVKKEEMDEGLIVKILINNRMFEELVNYNFIFDRTVKKLFEFVYKGGKYTYDPGFAFVQFLESGTRDVSVFKKQLREMLLSWDKIENRHALATLWTLLAKRGDLKKIFDYPQPQVHFRTVDPDPTRIISG